jgi:hypothetical protein
MPGLAWTAILLFTLPLGWNDRCIHRIQLVLVEMESHKLLAESGLKL